MLTLFFCFLRGDGADGRLGHKGTESLRNPTPVKAFNKSEYEKVVQVCAGASHSMALDLEGKVWTWGSCNYGKLGHPELQQTMASILVPKMVQGITRDPKEGVVSIHCNQFHSLAITNTHKLFVWGGNMHHCLGLGDPDHMPDGFHRWSPHEVQLGVKIIRATCGLSHTVAVSEQGQVFAWGHAALFKCGVEAKAGVKHYNKPVKIAYFDDKGVYKYFKETNVSFASRTYTPVAIAAGGFHSMALCDNRQQIVSWGSNERGQLGTGAQLLSDRPIPLSIFIEPHVFIRQIGCGASHSVCLTNHGRVYTWGSNSHGQLGLADVKSALTPMLIQSLATSHVDSISVGANTCAVVERIVDGKIENRIFSWGDNSSGQGGLGEKIKHQPFPERVKGFTAKARQFDVIEIAIGTQHMLLLGKNYDREKENTITKSRLYAVGRGQNGQLGVSTQSNSMTWTFEKVQVWEGWSKVLQENDIVDMYRVRREKRLKREKKREERRRAIERAKGNEEKISEADEAVRALAEAANELALRDKVYTESDAEYQEEFLKGGTEDGQ